MFTEDSVLTGNQDGGDTHGGKLQELGRLGFSLCQVDLLNGDVEELGNSNASLGARARSKTFDLVAHDELNK